MTKWQYFMIGSAIWVTPHLEKDFAVTLGAITCIFGVYHLFKDD